jgi:hypothetical protein
MLNATTFKYYKHHPRDAFGKQTDHLVDMNITEN